MDLQANTKQEGRSPSHEDIIRHQWIFLPVIGIEFWLLPLKYKAANASPFVTDNVIMLMFMVAFCVYFGSLTVKLLAHAPNLVIGEFINNITFLFGTLAPILLLLLLVRAFGWFFLVLWMIYAAKEVATKRSYTTAPCQVFNKMKELINGLLVETNNDVQPQTPPHIVVQIPNAGEPNLS